MFLSISSVPTQSFPIAVSTDDIFAVIQEELDEELGIEGEEVVEEFIVIHGIANWMAQ